MTRYWLTALMAAIGSLIITADPSNPSIAEAPVASVTELVTTTTSTTTTLPPTTTSTTTTTTIPAGDWLCPEWVPVALAVGWPAEQLPKLDRIIFRESTCRPTSYNGDDPNGGSRGLTQVNGIWCNWFLPDRGIVTICDDLFDPATNLTAALAIYNRSGWAPWGL